MKNWIVLSIFALLPSINAFGQNNLRKVVCDAQTKKGIPYATIKVINKPEGVYANEDGLFVVKALKSDSLLVTCIGYKPEKLVFPKADTIFLQPIVFVLNEVKVNAKKRKEFSIGYHNTKKAINFLGGNIHFEIATKLSIPEKFSSYRIKMVKIRNGNRNDPNPVRLHIYSQGKDGLPDKELLTEDIIINNCIKVNDDIDLTKLELVLSERVLFVGIEWVEGVFDRKIDHFRNIRFGFTNQVHEKNTYMRTLRDPEYRWRKMEGFPNDPANLMVSLIID